MAVAGTGQSTGVYAQPAEIALTAEQCGKLTRRVLLPNMVYGEVKAGQQLGELEYLLDGEVVRTLPLLADSDVAAESGELNFFQKLLGHFGIYV